MELLLSFIIFIVVVIILWNIAKRLIKFAVILFILYVLYEITLTFPNS